MERKTHQRLTRAGLTPDQIRKLHLFHAKQQDRPPAPCKRPLPTRKRPVKVLRPAQPDHNVAILLETPVATAPGFGLHPAPDWFSRQGPVEVSVIVPMFRSAEVLKDLVRSWDLANDGMDVEAVFVDDCCPANSKSALLSLWAERKSEIRGGIGQIVSLQDNYGFAAACNTGARLARGENLVFLNADTVLTHGWLRPLVRLLKRDDVGLAGNLQLKHGGPFHDCIDSAGSAWSWHDQTFHHIGRHVYNGQRLSRPFSLTNCPRELFEVAEREMVTGACIAVRKSLFDNLGGFDLSYRIGYWEDSDLCLTVREKGLKVMYQPNSRIYHKGGHSGAGGHRFDGANAYYFRNKWVQSGRIDRLVNTPRPTPAVPVRSVLVQRRCAHGDVLVAGGIARALKRRYPGCQITFSSDCPEVLRNHPHIDRLADETDVSARQFQLHINLDMVYERRPHSNILSAYAEAAGVRPEDCDVFLQSEPVDGLPNNYVVCHAGRTSWAGRDWAPLKFDMIANRLRQAGAAVVCVGTGADHRVACELDLRGRTNIAQLAHVVKNARMFVGIDSFPMHVAQAFDVPGVCFFGSVLPGTRIYRDSMRSVTADGLGCLGCHHRKPPPCTATNTCETGFSDCVNLVTVEMFWRKVEEVWSSACPKT